MEKLKRQLSLLNVFAISTGAMISSGLFVLPGIAYGISGPAVILAYALAGFLYIPALLNYAELATAMPKSGGSYFFIDRSMGPVMGTIGGISEWLSLVLKSSFALMGIGYMAMALIPGGSEIHMKIIAVAFGIIFVLLNIKGVRESGNIQIYMVVGLIAILLVYILEGIPRIDVHNYSPFMPFGRLSVLSAAGMVYISFAGLTKVVNVGEEIKEPGKNIPLGMFLAFGVVILLYALVIFVTVGLLSKEEILNTFAPLEIGAKKSMNLWGQIIISVAAFLAFATTANAGIMASSRILVSMSHDGHLPSFFSKINPKNFTPDAAIFVVGMIMAAFIIFVDLQTFVKMASAIMLILFILISLALIIMRESKIYNYKPIFESPLYPYIQIAAIVLYSVLLITIGAKPLGLIGFIILVGLIWHLIYARIQINRQSAMVHVLARFMKNRYHRDISHENLPAELREIVRERDEIVEDHFDHLVKEAVIMDLEDEATLVEFYEFAAETFAQKLNLDSEEILKNLMDRENEATSVIFEGLAIPHIIVEGECEFSLLIARSKAGINFTSEIPPVNTIFVFLGTKEMRPLYLRSLVAVTEIAQQRHFKEYWLAAKNTDALRNIILMGERKRIHLIYCLHCPEEVLFENRVLSKIGYGKNNKDEPQHKSFQDSLFEHEIW